MAKAKTEKDQLCESITGQGCGLKKIIGIIGGKWKILILCYIDAKEIGRFGEMKRTIYGITNTMLASSLKEMEADGLVERHLYDEMPVRVPVLARTLYCAGVSFIRVFSVPSSPASGNVS